jgi:hypothetical protein
LQVDRPVRTDHPHLRIGYGSADVDGLRFASSIGAPAFHPFAGPVHCNVVIEATTSCG